MVMFMKKTKKQTDCLSFRLDKKASDKLNEICNEVGLTKTKAVEKAIEKFYDEYKKKVRSD